MISRMSIRGRDIAVCGTGDRKVLFQERRNYICEGAKFGCLLLLKYKTSMGFSFLLLSASLSPCDWMILVKVNSCGFLLTIMVTFACQFGRCDRLCNIQLLFICNCLFFPVYSKQNINHYVKVNGNLIEKQQRWVKQRWREAPFSCGYHNISTFSESLDFSLRSLV